MEFAVLNNGVRIPKLGFGVFQIPREECEESVRAAIDVGYRLIDTAQSYFNEAEVGKAVAESGVPREEFFITTKYSLQGTTQGRYLTGGVPPVRFSM